MLEENQISLDKNLDKFYRAKVIDLLEKQNMDGDILVEVIDLGLKVVAKSTNLFSKSENDIKNYFNDSGEWDVPRVGDYLVIIFLNNDINSCYYLPFTLKFNRQVPTGMKLPSLVKENYLKLKERLNIKFREFFNGNIIGWDLNDENNMFFLVFDNGSKLEFASPNELVIDGNKKTNNIKPSFFRILVDKIDKFFSSTFDMIATKDDSKIVTRAFSKISIDKGKYSDYKNTEIKNDDQNDNISENEISVTKFGSINKNLVESNIETYNRKTQAYKVLSTDSNLANSVEFISYEDFSNNTIIQQKMTSLVNNEGIKNIRDVYIKTPNFSTQKKEEHNFDVVNNGSLNEDNFENNEYKNSKITFNQNTPENNKKSEISTIQAKDGSVSCIFEKKVEQDQTSVQISENLEIENSIQKAYSNSVNVITEDKIQKKVLMGNKELEKIQFVIENDIKNEKSSILFKNVYNSPNPADPKGIFELSPLVQKGHQIKSEVTKDYSLFEISSIKHAYPNDNIGITSYGSINSVKFEEKGTEALFEVSLGGVDTKLQSVKFRLNVTEKGEVYFEFPSGEFTIKSTTGKLNIDVFDTEIKSKTMKKNGNVIPDPTKGGPFNCIKTCPLTGLPHSGNTIIEG